VINSLLLATLLALGSLTAHAQSPHPVKKSAAPAVEVAPEPVLPQPLPQLPPPLAEQKLPYPLEFIDRPYTLPVGSKDLTLRGSAVNISTNRKEVHVPIYLAEIEFRKPITNDFTVVFNPLPLGLQHQPKRTTTTQTGVSWNVGWQYQGNYGVLPQFESFLRYKLWAKSAIEMQLTYWTFIPFKKAGSVWTGQFRIGPIFQQTRRFAMSPRIAVVVDNIRLDQIYLPVRTPIENQQLTAEKAQIHLPFNFWMGYAMNERWDVTFEYTLLGTGLGGHTYVHLGTLGLTARW
jgi:hypothetical protein